MATWVVGQDVEHEALGVGRVIYADDASVGVRFKHDGLRAFREDEASALRAPKERARVAKDAFATVSEDAFWAFEPATRHLLDNRERVWIHAFTTSKGYHRFASHYLTILGSELEEDQVDIQPERGSNYDRLYSIAVRFPRSVVNHRYPGAISRVHQVSNYVQLSHNAYCWYLLRWHGFSLGRRCA